MPEDRTDIGATVRRGVRRVLPVIGLAAFLALVLLLITTEVKANDAAPGDLEMRVYIQRSFYVLLTIGLLLAAYVASRGKA